MDQRNPNMSVPTRLMMDVTATSSTTAVAILPLLLQEHKFCLMRIVRAEGD